MLLEHYLILRQSDLEAWEEDPEEWILEITGDVVSAESGLRVLSFYLWLTKTSGEALFMDLFSNYKEEMLKFTAGCVNSLQRMSHRLFPDNRSRYDDS
jgi:hypothetical protein